MEKNLFLYYGKCGTCRKAKAWLDKNNINYEIRSIIDDKPKEEELKNWIKLSNLPIKRFFNTSGVLYKEMNLKEKYDTINDEEKIKLLAKDGKLVKRPIFVNKEYILLGFKEEEWEKIIKK